MSEMLCKECMEFYKIDEDEEYLYTFSEGVCEGCFHRKKVANPNYWLKLCSPKIITAFPAISKNLGMSKQKEHLYI